jgi:hypothetical protein
VSASREPLLTRRFVVVMLSGFCYFGAIGVLLPGGLSSIAAAALAGVGVLALLATTALGWRHLSPARRPSRRSASDNVLMISGAAVVGVTRAGATVARVARQDRC